LTPPLGVPGGPAPPPPGKYKIKRKLNNINVVLLSRLNEPELMARVCEYVDGENYI